MTSTDTASHTLAVFNPIDLTLVDTVAESTVEEIDAALGRSYALFRDRAAWLPEHTRIAVLERTASLMED
ncbi:MAG: hypothetical protein EBT18_10495, partial [Gammaproteobacteria bacterium]|nr:hypothetical protein [Gammaproteobacteria bacterium]